jgi:hypothetical protein
MDIWVEGVPSEQGTDILFVVGIPPKNYIPRHAANVYNPDTARYAGISQEICPIHHNRYGLCRMEHPLI